MFYLSLFKNPKFVLFITLLIVTPFVGFNLFKSNQKLLGASTQASSLPSQSPVPPASPLSSVALRSESSGSKTLAKEETPSPTPTPAPKLSKAVYTIAVFGDSMVDTMGENLEYLDTSLKIKYPNTTFKLYNYGIGGQNVADGVARFKQAFSYQTRNYPSVKDIKADVIILGSFAYNPFPTHDRNRHWTTLTQLVNEAKSTGASIYILAEIGPKQTGFGQGPGGINWPKNLVTPHVEHIIEQLENAIALSKELNVPLINAYEKSKIGTKYGNPLYVSSHDGIHPSREGHILMANLITNISL